MVIKSNYATTSEAIWACNNEAIIDDIKDQALNAAKEAVWHAPVIYISIDIFHYSWDKVSDDEAHRIGIVYSCLERSINAMEATVTDFMDTYRKENYKLIPDHDTVIYAGFFNGDDENPSYELTKLVGDMYKDLKLSESTLMGVQKQTIASIIKGGTTDESVQ